MHDRCEKDAALRIRFKFVSNSIQISFNFKFQLFAFKPTGRLQVKLIEILSANFCLFSREQHYFKAVLRYIVGVYEKLYVNWYPALHCIMACFGMVALLGFRRYIAEECEEKFRMFLHSRI